MGKAVLISIRPNWCALIANGKKTVEVRKNHPKLETPFKCYIYCTNRGRPLVFGDIFTGDWEMEYTQTYNWSREDADRIWGVMNGKVIGEFVCDKIDTYDYEYCTHPEIGMDYDCGDNWFCVDDADLKNACMSYEELRAYAGNKDVYGWHISDLVIYDEPKSLNEFRQNRPPQSWCYMEQEAE